ncbi:F0F1 ATP synthase subunit epsilon [Tranquillimonas alkanivorans]|uniref:ATP synthase epsilon chain n=1 Tax=Tranquillimonas alkanivorans TaxID=441119 RepID=A0A1I5NC62_9RHOB|nr:F0F1 ATP synthase subunit epsilon [Tranquillimonas alkanivorans]SFP19359.1 ATP synthase F1 subcomplex epsilon subunit [Tranquillimonas alkanivorans]
MADTMQFDLVSPERLLVSRQVSEVRIPGTDGDLTAMPTHAPALTTMRPGILRIVSSEGADEYAVTGGFAEITADGVSVLAEESLHVSEVTQEDIDRFVEHARRQHEKAREAGDHTVADDAAKLLADMVAMGSHIGLSPSQPNL